MTPQSFDEWLLTADEDELRLASEFRHHYPVELTAWDYDENMNELGERHEVACGCNPAFKAFGHELIGEHA